MGAPGTRDGLSPFLHKRAATLNHHWFWATFDVSARCLHHIRPEYGIGVADRPKPKKSGATTRVPLSKNTGIILR